MNKQLKDAMIGLDMDEMDQPRAFRPRYNKVEINGWIERVNTKGVYDFFRDQKKIGSIQKFHNDTGAYWFNDGDVATATKDLGTAIDAVEKKEDSCSGR